MDQDQNQIVATLAAAIVVSRNATTIAAIREAWTDATWIISPAPTTARYKAWQELHGEVPTTPEMDEQAAQKRSEGLKQSSAKIGRHMARYGNRTTR